MAYTPLPRKGTPERERLRQQITDMIEDGVQYRDIAQQLNLASLAAVSRLYHEGRKLSETEEQRAAHRAYLDYLAAQLDQAFAPALHSEDPSKMALLVQAGVRLDESRRKLDGTDKPVTLRVEGTEQRRGPDVPTMEQWMAQLHGSPMFRDGLRAAGLLDEENEAGE